MELKYSDGKQDVVIKMKYAYHDKAGTDIKMGQTNIQDEGRVKFIDKLIAMGFKNLTYPEVTND